MLWDDPFAARDLGLLWLVVLGIAMSAVSLYYYYLLVLKRAYVVEDEGQAPPISIKTLSGVAILLLAVVVVALGCLPAALMEHPDSAQIVDGWKWPR